MSSSWEQEPPHLYARAGRVAGAGLVGAAFGAAVAGIWQAGAVAASNACRPPAQGEATGFCIPVVQPAIAVLGSVVVICLGVLIAFALLRLRPLRVTIPIGCVVVAWTTFFTAAGFPGGRGPAPWAAAIAAGAGLAAVALAVDWGRAQLVGMIAVAVVLLASLVAPRTIARQEEADAQVRQFAALGFPLELPSVPGYHPSGAYPSADGALVVDMMPDAGTTFPAPISVVIAPAANAGMARDLAKCVPAPPRFPCRALRPGQWLITTGTPPMVLAEKADVGADGRGGLGHRLFFGIAAAGSIAHGVTDPTFTRPNACGRTRTCVRGSTASSRRWSGAATG